VGVLINVPDGEMIHCLVRLVRLAGRPPGECRALPARDDCSWSRYQCGSRWSFDFGPFSRVVDVGGGRGQLLSAILARYSHISGVLFDLPFAGGMESARGTTDHARPCNLKPQQRNLPPVLRRPV